MGRILDEIDVMDVAGRMELRHEQCVHVPEFGLDERASHFLKSHADQFRLDLVEKLAIGMFFPDADSRRAQADGVFSESFRSPAAVFQHFRTELRHLFSATPCCIR